MEKHRRAHKPIDRTEIRMKIGEALGKELTGPLYYEDIEQLEMDNQTGDEPDGEKSKSESTRTRVASARERSETIRGRLVALRAMKAKKTHKIHHRHRSQHHAVGEWKLHTIHHKDGTREERRRKVRVARGKRTRSRKKQQSDATDSLGSSDAAISGESAGDTSERTEGGASTGSVDAGNAAARTKGDVSTGTVDAGGAAKPTES
jgi:hypothetical protein